MKLLAPVLLVLAQSSADWKRVDGPVALEFPRDHGAHLDHRTEWWYATAEVESDTGARFGVQLTLFRHGLETSTPRAGESPLRARHAFAGHLALVDLSTGRLVHAERARRGTPGLAQASEATLDARLDGWSVRLDERGRVRLDAADRRQRLSIALELTPEKRAVLHGANGVSAKGDEAGNASVYVSWTRLSVVGELEFDGLRHRVRGGAWFDHEWGTTQLGAGVVGWDWFGLRLEDGRELMLYRLRREDGALEAASSATVVERDGTTQWFSSAEVACERTDTWKSPRTGADYPAGWRVRIARAGIDLELRPRVSDCEIDGRRSTGVVYWEGPVDVRGTVAGTGYAELTGYAGSLAGRF